MEEILRKCEACWTYQPLNNFRWAGKAPCRRCKECMRNKLYRCYSCNYALAQDAYVCATCEAIGEKEENNKIKQERRDIQLRLRDNKMTAALRFVEALGINLEEVIENVSQ